MIQLPPNDWYCVEDKIINLLCLIERICVIGRYWLHKNSIIEGEKIKKNQHKIRNLDTSNFIAGESRFVFLSRK